MKDIVLAATAGLFLGAVTLPAVAGDNYYLLSVDILAEDGSVALHKQVKCPRYDKCINNFPFISKGKQQTLAVKTQVADDHHFQIAVYPDMRYIVDGQVRDTPFDPDTEVKPFESGSEWTMVLQKVFVVPLDPSKRKFNWITTEHQRRTVLKVHMKLDS